VTATDDTMLAAYVTELGGPDVIRIGALPVPRTGPTELLVEVDAVAASRVDAFVRSGWYATPTPFPFIVGRDLVGTVRHVGVGVTSFTEGDRVWCNSLGHDGRQGAFAQFAAVPVERAYRLPDDADPRTTVAVAQPAATAYLAWFVHGDLRPGQTVYVGGAAGNVGRAAVQIAYAAGARVIAGARTVDHDACLADGADAAIEYDPAHLVDRLAEVAPDNVDVYWNTSVDQDLDVAIRVMRPGGRVIVAAGDPAVTVPVRQMYMTDVSVHGFVISRASAADLAGAAALINRMVPAGSLTTNVTELLPLAATADVHRRLEAGDVRGRIVLRPAMR
jgi:NADPH:quinone reductase-like Zn-dependent oxidoreductase